jgi:hypothetical protein
VRARMRVDHEEMNGVGTDVQHAEPHDRTLSIRPVR